MLMFEINKKDTDEIMAFFEDAHSDVGIVETHRFSGSSELIQIAVMVTAATICGIISLVKGIRSGSIDATVRGNGDDINPEDITEEYLRENRDDVQ